MDFKHNSLMTLKHRAIANLNSLSLAPTTFITYTQRKKKHHRPVSRQGQHQNHDNLGNRPTSGIPGCLTTTVLGWLAAWLTSCLNPKKLLLWNTYLRPRLTKDLSKMARMEDCSHTNNKKQQQQPKKIIIHAYH